MKSWSTIELGVLCDVVSGVTKDAKRAQLGMRDVPYLRVANVQRLRLALDDLRMIPATEADIRAYALEVGDVLLNEGGDRDKLGRGWIWEGQAPLCIHQNHVFRARIRDGQVTPRWLAYFTNSDAAQAYFFGAGKQTTNLASISSSRLKRLPVPVPKPAEQDSIVAAIETHFSRLDAAVASLNRAKANVKRARASVLKAAVEGRLVPTEAALARAEGRDYEPASVLLDRILAERKAAWAASGARGKYQEPVKPVMEGLTELPEGWVWASMDQIAHVVGGITKDSKQTEGRPVPYLRVANVQRGRLDLEEVKTIIAPEDKIAALRLQPDDVLLNEGGDRDKLGRGWVWRGEIAECIHQNHVFRARLWAPAFDSRYLSHYANTQGDRYFLLEGKQTTNLASISLSKVKFLPVATPPRGEIPRILAEVDRRLSVLDALDRSVDANLARCARLRQSILKRAFEARLVPPEAPPPRSPAHAPEQVPLFGAAPPRQAP